MVATPRVTNIGAIRDTLPENTLIHLTPEQWQDVIEDIPRGTRLPKVGVVLVCMPDPNGGVVVMPHSRPSGADEECGVVPVLAGGGRPGGGGWSVTYQCRCRQRRNGDRPGAPPQLHPHACEITFLRAGNRKYAVGCDDRNCGGRCKLVRVVVPGSASGRRPIWQLACECGGT